MGLVYISWGEYYEMNPRKEDEEFVFKKKMQIHPKEYGKLLETNGVSK